MITASCGHNVESVDDLYDLQVKSNAADGSPSITYGCYCKSCVDFFESSGLIIHNTQEEYEWVGEHTIDNIETNDALSMFSIASSLINHADSKVSSFAQQVCDYLIQQEDNKNIIKDEVYVTLNTGNNFVLLIDDRKVSKQETLCFDNINKAILALNGVSIISTRPIVVYTPDEIYNISESSTEQYSYFIRYCHEAALSLLDGVYNFTKGDEHNGCISIKRK